MVAWGIISVAVDCAAGLGFWLGYSCGKRATTERDARFTRLGRWLGDAITGVHDNHKFHGIGAISTSKGRAKLPNGETYVVTVEMERP